jgi:twitching motility protein PilT
MGLQKMLRLLGNSDSQSQALAHALRAVLCQALLPSLDANCYYLATECLTSSPDVARLVESGDLSGIREYLNSRNAHGSYPMNSSLERMLASGQISLEDARNATTDRLGLAYPT